MDAKSDVSSATKDTLFTRKTSPKIHALTLEWVYGRTPILPVFALQDQDKQVVLYAAENVAVIYNHTSNSQHILQGHSHNLCCLCVSEDRRWVATADPSPMILVWDSYSGIPVCTLFDCHPKHGFANMSFSKDTKYLVTLGAGRVQHVCVWDWTCNTETPLSCIDLSPNYGFQEQIVLNSSSSEFLSCSETHVVLYTLEQKNLSCFALRLRKGGAVDPHFPSALHSVAKADAALVQAVFHWREPQVLTATTGGSVVVWNLDFGMAKSELSKNVILWHLQEAPFTAMTVSDSYIVTGDVEGVVKFFGQNFEPLAFYTDLVQQPIWYISLSSEATAGFVLKNHFIRNFIVSTCGSSVLHVNAETNEVHKLLEEEPEPVQALCCHPERPLLVTGNNGSLLRVRDISNKLTVARRKFSAQQPISCITYDRAGSLLAVGFSSGSVHILDSSSLQSDPEQGFDLCKDSIQLLSFSDDSLFLAAADSGFAVTVLKRDSDEAHWKVLGRYRSHYKPIRSLLFGLCLDSTRPRLLSLGLDRRLVEYDLQRLSDLRLLSTERVEQLAVPLSMTWCPPVSREQFLLLCNDQYKLRLINSTTHVCRKVIRAPTHSSPLQRILILPKTKEDQSKTFHMAFITHNMVLLILTLMLLLLRFVQ
ncbi:hypothetical protein WMY93_004240 [Mugilogobius chulae]|uniref:Cilia- and flagella-associated protein 251 n=1 Tax=Mugilogobius chulae TaxID=88201 RepID=A0AAW0PQH2_9GOBI